MSNNAPDYVDNLFFSPEKPLNLYEENQQLKELLKECKANLIHRKQLLEKLDKLEKPTKELLTKIDNAIGEKK